MRERRRYRKRTDKIVTAVRIGLDTDGFSYTKWGAEQRCKRGDWLVDNDGDTYTVDDEVFPRTYRRVGAGQYLKMTPVWAEQAAAAGSVVTKEGVSSYRAGDYIVFNQEDGSDGYCISADRFHSTYELDE